ncbi:2-oxoacid:acceptor oxidoreductase subunit alpha [Patescibacteria group bacterium]|nr:2-oxoacid:acceptor oxidoreductase subunit alpha [Patescibacteria group bacterium]MBU1472223.1 2-oxoacid:acceptor oxidoreductase subunit alpha [Patescibacteria group bacterium]MBU2460525.1 2-oxoacid:acceptor oxidoreductase subunit alpha [Patescibacteria group bacterium]
MLDSVTCKIGGEAGFGIMASGSMVAKTFLRAGYHVFTMNEYPSLIRGGHNVVTVRVSALPFESLDKHVHVLIALSKETVQLHNDELDEGAVIMFDPKDGELSKKDFSKSSNIIQIPFIELVTKHKGNPVMRNTVALGALIALAGTDFSYLSGVISEQFKSKKQEVIDHNITIAKAGYDYVRKHFGQITSVKLPPVKPAEKQALVNASEAVGIGALQAGMKFAAIYPMTPINALITFLIQYKKKYAVVYKQPEDEIAGINMAIGASIAGVRSMVATSGGGFALMEEGLSFAGIAEVPLVIDLGMRVGPASGMPTWSEQGELRFAIHAGHGEFLRIVLAPGDALEAYRLTLLAFDLADRYQTPVFVLTDKYMNESQFCVPVSKFEKTVSIDRGKLLTQKDLEGVRDYKRYALDAVDGISDRGLPGMKNGCFMTNSYEHDEHGFSIEESGARVAMVEKRAKKLRAVEADIMPPTVYGDPKADIALVGWGSTKGPILEAVRLLTARGRPVRYLHFPWVYPFPAEAAKKLLEGVGRIIYIENNSTAQFASLMYEHTGIKAHDTILKYDGRPFYPEEIVEKLISLVINN